MPRYQADVRRNILREFTQSDQLEVEAAGEEEARRLVEELARDESTAMDGEGMPGEVIIRSVDIRSIEATVEGA